MILQFHICLVVLYKTIYLQFYMCILWECVLPSHLQLAPAVTMTRPEERANGYAAFGIFKGSDKPGL